MLFHTSFFTSLSVASSRKVTGRNRRYSRRSPFSLVSFVNPSFSLEDMQYFLKLPVCSISCNNINRQVKYFGNFYNNVNNIYVFSMTEDYDSDAMWGLYANSNRGFCIEYDFRRAKELSIAIKRKLCCLFQIMYLKEIKEFSFEKLDRYFFSEFQDTALYAEINQEILSHLLSKEIIWKNEKEWRLLLFELKDNRLYADLVSGLIIDERVLQTNNAKTLIRLAEDRGWNIKVRKVNVLGTKHFYEKYVP